jgi:hypothetical protein
VAGNPGTLRWDDNASWKRYVAFSNKIVIPTEPGFSATLRWTKPRVLLSLRKAAWSAPTPPSSTGNPGERSVVEGSAVRHSAFPNFPWGTRDFVTEPDLDNSDFQTPLRG